MSEDTGETREGRVIAAIPEDSYAHRLMLARAHAGHLTIRAAAERCGLNYASWANWERGMRSRTQVEDADAISDGLGVDRDWLLHGGALTPAQRLARRIGQPRYIALSRTPRAIRTGPRRPRRVDRPFASEPAHPHPR